MTTLDMAAFFEAVDQRGHTTGAADDLEADMRRAGFPAEHVAEAVPRIVAARERSEAERERIASKFGHRGVRLWLRQLRQTGSERGDTLCEYMAAGDLEVHGMACADTDGNAVNSVLEELERRGTIRRGAWRPHPAFVEALGRGRESSKPLTAEGARTIAEPHCLLLLGYMWHPRYRSAKRSRRAPAVLVVRPPPATVEQHFVDFVHDLRRDRPLWEQEEITQELRRAVLSGCSTAAIITELAGRNEPEAQAAYSEALR